jgi:MinD superfamily P-loop ATPase
MPILGIIENMSGFVCPHCSQKVDIFGSGGGEKTAEELNIPFLGKIPLDTNIVRSGDEGKPFVLFQNSVSSQAFTDITERIQELAEADIKVK